MPVGCVADARPARDAWGREPTGQAGSCRRRNLRRHKQHSCGLEDTRLLSQRSWCRTGLEHSLKGSICTQDRHAQGVSLKGCPWPRNRFQILPIATASPCARPPATSPSSTIGIWRSRGCVRPSTGSFRGSSVRARCRSTRLPPNWSWTVRRLAAISGPSSATA